MKLVNAGAITLLLNADGAIHGPYSIYLNEKFDNPHTRDSASNALRLFDALARAHSIDLSRRALNSQCLKPSEITRLVQLAYRPLDEVELMSDKMIRRIAEPNSSRQAMDIEGAVEPNTASKKLCGIADFLNWYFEKILSPRVRSPSALDALSQSYNQNVRELKGRIGGAKTSHHNQIRSLPQDRFLQVIREIFINEDLFKSDVGTLSSTANRDRAIALLACEGLRPGAIGNLVVDNFRWRPGDTKGYVRIRDNTARRKMPITVSTPVQKGARSTTQPYNSEITIKLWPWTCLAVDEYINGERAEVTGRQLKNKTKGFLFVAEHGGPIGDRTTLSAVFKRLERGLLARDLLDTVRSDPYAEGKHYELTAYTLRHSAVSLFYARKRHEHDVLDQMRERFGWSKKSETPTLYARRAISDAANLDMEQFYDSLLAELKEVRRARGG